MYCFLLNDDKISHTSLLLPPLFVVSLYQVPWNMSFQLGRQTCQVQELSGAMETIRCSNSDLCHEGQANVWPNEHSMCFFFSLLSKFWRGNVTSIPHQLLYLLLWVTLNYKTPDKRIRELRQFLSLGFIVCSLRVWLWKYQGVCCWTAIAPLPLLQLICCWS